MAQNKSTQWVKFIADSKFKKKFHYSKGDEIEKYLQDFATEFGLLENIKVIFLSLYCQKILLH